MYGWIIWLCDVDGKPSNVLEQGHNGYYLLGVFIECDFRTFNHLFHPLEYTDFKYVIGKLLDIQHSVYISTISSICIAYNEIQTLLTFYTKVDHGDKLKKMGDIDICMKFGNY